ncbi:MAG TPA: response regulator [Aggregatilineales bacterium]|nr:response regulator [Aggregatilineales bacterium]
MPAHNEIANWNILLVDDEPDNLEVARKVLSFYGAQTFCAMDGIEGLKQLEQIYPTVILLDLSMPHMDGFEMIKRVRENPHYHELTVIALTAHAMSGDREKVMAAGFDGYIAKPFRIESLLNDIKEIVRDADAVRQSRVG